MSGEPEGHRKLRFFLEDSCTHSLTPSPSSEATAWKVPGSYEKEIHWLILGCVLEGQGAGGTFSEDRSAGRPYFVFTLFLPIMSLSLSSSLTPCTPPLCSLKEQQLTTSLPQPTPPKWLTHHAAAILPSTPPKWFLPCPNQQVTREHQRPSKAHPTSGGQEMYP